MTDLLTRHGSVHTGPVHQDAKGPFFVRTRTCGRCGGAGRSEAWKFTGFTCYDCGGSGTRGTEMVRLFTREQIAKLDATAAKKRANKQAKLDATAAVAKAEAEARRVSFEAEHGALIAAAEPFLERDAFLADVIRKATERCQFTIAQLEAVTQTVARLQAREAERAEHIANSRHVGKPGERIETAVTVERIITIETQFGPLHICTMRDAAGNALVSKGRFHAEKGEQFTIRGTVKEHSDFRGEQQTQLQRVAIQDKEAAA